MLILGTLTRLDALHGLEVADAIQRLSLDALHVEVTDDTTVSTAIVRTLRPA